MKNRIEQVRALIKLVDEDGRTHIWVDMERQTDGQWRMICTACSYWWSNGRWYSDRQCTTEVTEQRVTQDLCRASMQMRWYAEQMVLDAMAVVEEE